MRLLVSVRNAAEATAALAGGADIIDAKEPARGALGAVALATFREIVACVDGRVPVSAALGDADDEDTPGARAGAFAEAGAAFVKVGFAGLSDPARVSAVLRATVDAVGRRCDVVPVAYAEGHAVDSPDPSVLIAIAVNAGARMVLLDTADKLGPAVRTLMGDAALRWWIRRAHDAGLMAAVAGKLTADDFHQVCDAADIVGVRGAACENGRAGTVTSAKVHTLRARLNDATHATGARQTASALFVAS